MVEECQEVARINGNEIYEIKKVAMLDIDVSSSMIHHFAKNNAHGAARKTGGEEGEVAIALS